MVRHVEVKLEQSDDGADQTFGLPILWRAVCQYDGQDRTLRQHSTSDAGGTLAACAHFGTPARPRRPLLTWRAVTPARRANAALGDTAQASRTALVECPRSQSFIVYLFRRLRAIRSMRIYPDRSAISAPVRGFSRSRFRDSADSRRSAVAFRLEPEWISNDLNDSTGPYWPGKCALGLE
jgi:hypothetical protein